MAFSVNTNAGAFLALQSLSSTNRELATTQDRISTGLQVASVRDDSATFLIAQNQRSDLAGINAARSSLDRASSTLDVGVNAAEAVSDLLISAREIAVSVQDTGLDQASVDSLNRDFSALVSQIDSIVGQAEFNGVNIVNGGGQNVDAITGVNRAGDISRISVAGVDLRTNSTTATSTLDTFDLGTLDNLGSIDGTSDEQQAILAALRNAGDDQNAIVADANGVLSIDVSVATLNNAGTAGDTTDDSFEITFGGGAITFATAAGDSATDTAPADGVPDIAATSALFLGPASAGDLVIQGAQGAFGAAAIGGVTPGATDIALRDIDFSNDAQRSSAVAVVDNFQQNVGTILSQLGSAVQQVELQSTFASNLSDSIEVGIGNLVDADLSREAANLQALQVQQQLGLQAAGIANQAPGSILALFR
ncbi:MULTISPECIES: flagellin [unclassified Iodidimonas]|jgi:flagellin|uniref:flagellin n=1 Tax=unclassified Iodidimonas TaxID=2626145 RepID=UPI002482115C|nr:MULTISPECIES: flagellin [unclassified Iodidimonas]